MNQLFGAYAHRYDLHTPPDHYRHDHEFVIELARRQGPKSRLLDVGCGTGVLLQKALAAGIVATGLDASAEMVRVAVRRVGPGVATVQRMQDLSNGPTYDVLVSLSWCINYCDSREALTDVLRRFHRALNPGGRLLVQVAHAAHVRGNLFEDREPGPSGEPKDVTFLYRFEGIGGLDHAMHADYVYACKTTNELLFERHLLKMADARAVAECIREVGFQDIELFDSWRRDPFRQSASPFIVGQKEQ